MSSREKFLVRKLYHEIINGGEFDKLREVLDPEIVWHDPMLPNGEVQGIKGFESVLTMFRSAFPDLQIIVEDMVQEEEKVVTRFIIQGTHTGDLMGIHPTGKKFQISGMSIIRFDHGKAVEEWIEEDTLGLLRQLGVVNRRS